MCAGPSYGVELQPVGFDGKAHSKDNNEECDRVGNDKCDFKFISERTLSRGVFEEEDTRTGHPNCEFELPTESSLYKPPIEHKDRDLRETRAPEEEDLDNKSNLFIRSVMLSSLTGCSTHQSTIRKIFRRDIPYVPVEPEFFRSCGGHELLD
jgi:hypothetical protein